MAEVVKPSVLSWGEVLWDLFPNQRRLGGCAGNVAFHLAQLGIHSRLVSRVGTDELGDAALDQLGAAGVDIALVQRDAARATGTVRVTIEGGEPRFTIASEAAWDRIEWEPALAEAVSSANVLYYGTLAQRTPLGAGALRSAWGRTPEPCVRVCDVNLRRPLPRPNVVLESVRAAHVVKLNATEMQLLGEMFGTRDVVAWLLELGIQLVALTLGNRGCVLTRDSERVEHPGFPLLQPGGDPVGAGDAFTAVICEWFAAWRKGPLEVLAERANRIAAYVASSSGATPSLPASLIAVSDSARFPDSAPTPNEAPVSDGVAPSNSD